MAKTGENAAFQRRRISVRSAPSIFNYIRLVKQSVETNDPNIYEELELPLHQAASEGNAELVNKLLRENASDMDVKDDNCWLPVHVAAAAGYTAVVRILVEAMIREGKSVDKTTGGILYNYMEMTPLYLASQNGRCRTVRELLKFGAETDKCTTVKWLPLHAAASNGHLSVVRLLVPAMVENLVGLDAVSDAGQTALYLATEAGQQSIVRELLRHGARVDIPDNCNSYPLHVAAIKGYTAILRLLLNKMVSLQIGLDACDRYGHTALYLAAQEGSYEITKILLKNGAKNRGAKDSLRPLHIAASNGYTDVVSLLMSAMIKERLPLDVIGRGSTALHLAAQRGKYEVVSQLLKSGLKTNIFDSEECLPLHLAAHMGHVLVVAVLASAMLKDGLGLDVMDGNGRTALCIASHHGRQDVVHELLIKGANPDICSKQGDSPLHIAAYIGHLAVVRTLAMFHSEHGLRLDGFNRNGCTAMSVASQEGTLAVVHSLLNYGANPGVADGNGWLPLHRAAYNGHTPVVRELSKAMVEAKIGLDTLTSDNQTALYLASHRGNTETIEELVLHGAKLDISDKNGLTPLHIAVYKGHGESVAILAVAMSSAGIPLDALTADGRTALYLATNMGNNKMVGQLLRSKARTDIGNQKGWLPLHKAVMKGHMSVVKDLISAMVASHVDINAVTHDGRSSLYMSSQQGYKELVSYLLKVGLKVDASDQHGWLPLHIAAHKGHLPCIKVLASAMVKSRVGLNAQTKEGYSALYIGVQDANREVVKELLRLGACPLQGDTYNNSPLHVACETGASRLVKILLMYKTDIQVKLKNIYGQTALHIVSSYSLRLSKYLINRGASTQTCDNEGMTALHIATLNGQSHIVEYLLQVDSKVDICNCDFHTPFHVACLSGHVDIMDMLIPFRPNLNHRDIHGSSALHLACQKNYLLVVDWLIQHGADVRVCDDTGQQPLHIATRSLNLDIAELLISNGACVSDLDIRHESPLFCAIRNSQFSFATPIKKRFITKSICGIIRFLLSKGASAKTRNILGQTVLHVAVEHHLSTVVLDLLVTSGVRINNTDFNKHTPLHVAAMVGNVEAAKFLLMKGAFLHAKDKCGLLPAHFANEQFKVYLKGQMAHRKGRAQRCFASGKNKEVHSFNTILASIENATALHSPSNCSSQGRCHEIDAINLNDASIDKWLCKASLTIPNLTAYGRELFSSFSDSNTDRQTEWHLVTQTLRDFVSDISRTVKKRRPEVSFTPILSGSLREKTKVIEPNEGDFLCMLDNVREECLHPPEHPSHNLSCVTLEFQGQSQQCSFMNSAGMLDRHKVFDTFHRAISDALCDPHLWAAYPQLYCHSVNDITANKQSISHLQLIWHGPAYCWLPVTVDMVPAIALPNWQPPWCRKHPAVRQHGCYAAAKWIPDAASHLPLFQLSFSGAESQMFEDMPAEMRDGYKLAKIMLHTSICPVIDKVEVKWFITSFMLKTCIFKEYDLLCMNRESLKTRSQMLTVKTRSQSSRLRNGKVEKSSLNEGTGRKRKRKLFDDETLLVSGKRRCCARGKTDASTSDTHNEPMKRGDIMDASTPSTHNEHMKRGDNMDTSVTSSTHSEHMKRVLHWTRRIYARLEYAFQQQQLESFFLPGYNLLSDSKYDTHRKHAVTYASLIRRFLTRK